MCDCYSLAPLSHEFGTLAPRIRGNELSGRINGRILAPQGNSNDSDREANRKGRILSHYILRDDFKPSSSSIGLSRKASGGYLRKSKNYGAARIRSNSEGISGNSGDKKPKKYESFDEFVDKRSSSKDGLNPTTGSGDEQESSNIGDSVPSSFNFLELKRELEKEEKESGKKYPKEDEWIRSEGQGSDTLNHEELEGLVGQLGVKGGRKLMRRSNLLAKQVISIQSACSLGFVSQLWVDTRSVSGVLFFKQFRSFHFSCQQKRCIHWLARAIYFLFLRSTLVNLDLMLLVTFHYSHLLLSTNPSAMSLIFLIFALQLIY